MRQKPADRAVRVEAERQEDAVPIMVAVRPGVFLGNVTAACDARRLARHAVTQTLNLAVNADPPPLRLPDGTDLRRAKIGLIDGKGNHPAHVAAAVLAIDGMLAQPAPGKPSYGAHRPGALLVHCRGGRSRSVAVMALWLARSDPRFGGQVTTAIEALRSLRGLGSDQPNADIFEAMHAAERLLAAIPAVSCAAL